MPPEAQPNISKIYIYMIYKPDKGYQIGANEIFDDVLKSGIIAN